MPCGLDFLRIEIKNLREPTFDRRRYINPVALRNLCTRDVIGEAVRDCSYPVHRRDRMINDIFENGIFTFCILVHKGHERFLPKFLECDPQAARDTRLPLDENTLKEIAKEAAADFFEAQWEFRPVMLARYQYLQLNIDYILPFRQDEHDEDQDGSFGAIHNVVIDSSMQKLIKTNQPTVKVIRKQLRLSGNTEGFERERQCLEVLQDLKHENIVELLCSYTYRDKHNLVFKCEDMNLNEFLSLEDRYEDFISDVVFYRALYGLASAIHYIHNCDIGGEDESRTIIGYHHDIRPHNILIRRNTFVLADFGLAKIEDRDNSSSSYKGGGGDYIAPECLEKGARIKCAADIWSFGGVIVDIASYMEGGPQARIEAQNKRESNGPFAGTTNCFFFCEGMVKPAVTEQIERLQENPRDKTTRTLLKLSKSMLMFQAESRPDANVVRDNLAYIALKSLFRSALEAMIEWNTIQWKKQARGPAPDRRWEDTWKLWAWGEEVGINKVRLVPKVFQDALQDGENTAKKLENHLVDLVNLLASQIDDTNRRILKLSRRGTDLDIIYNNGDENKINECIRDLKSALPGNYRTRIETQKAYYGPFARRFPPTLPMLSNENIQYPHPSPNPTETFLHSSDTSGDEGDLIKTVSTASVTTGKDTPTQSVKGKEKASTTSTPADTPASSNMTRLSADSSSSPIQTTMTTPNSSGSSRVNFNKPLPSSPLSLPSPALGIGQPVPPAPEGLTIFKSSAIISFFRKGELCEYKCSIEVIEKRVSGRADKIIVCDCWNSPINFRHEVSTSIFAYPHMEHPSGDTGDLRTVSFFAPQIITEPTHLNLRANPIRTQIDYTFTDPKACDAFRQDIWGKRLLHTAGASQISWPPLAEANTLRITLWREHSDPQGFSVVFRGSKKSTRQRNSISQSGHEMISLNLARDRPVQKSDHKHLYLLLEEDSVATHVRRRPEKKDQKLRVTFDDEDDCAIFRNYLIGVEGDESEFS